MTSAHDVRLMQVPQKTRAISKREMHTPDSWSRGLATIAKRAGKLHSREPAEMNKSAQT